MKTLSGRAAACPQEPITSVILNGGAWKARLIRNNCLRQHCHELAAAFRRPELVPLKETSRRILEVIEGRSRILVEIHPNTLAVVAAVARLSAYAAQWIRQPEDWWPQAGVDARRQWAHLLRHLLARHPVPEWLDTAWARRGPLQDFERDRWCAIGKGREVREVSRIPGEVAQEVLDAGMNPRRAVRDKQAPFSSAAWPPMLGSEQLGAVRTHTKRRNIWRMEELCSADALALEGQIMDHCVATYACRCRAGVSAIFSLRRYRPNGEFECWATLEVKPQSQRIVQIRGYKNGRPKPRAVALAAQWAAANGLCMSSALWPLWR